jgi:3-oxoacyl-[acyl-carrier protein] reductase
VDLGFDGRRALVVGGSYGIGLAAARQMAEEGAALTLVSRKAENLRDAASSIEGVAGRRPATIVADVTEAGAAEHRTRV